MTPRLWIDDLVALGPCEEAVAWARTQPDLATAWRVCDRGDWMLWLIDQTIARRPRSKARKRLVWVACQCARLAWACMDRVGRKAITTAEAWTRGTATLAQVRAAASVAFDSAANASAAYAANASANAFDAASAAASVADAASVANASANAFDAALAHCADLVRAEWPDPPPLKKVTR